MFLVSCRSNSDGSRHFSLSHIAKDRLYLKFSDVIMKPSIQRHTLLQQYSVSGYKGSELHNLYLVPSSDPFDNSSFKSRSSNLITKLIYIETLYINKKIVIQLFKQTHSEEIPSLRLNFTIW